DLTVRGPEGIEYIQIVASRTPIPIPDWGSRYDLVAEGDPLDFLDYINAVYFDCDNGCSLAFDMTLFTVNEWHEEYYRPTHHYHHNDWNMTGMIYVDYPWGATIYIDGVYWGIAPLFIPRIYYGWHYITIYDRYGYCWEDRVNVFRRKSVVLDNTIIKTRAGVKSKYRDVRKKAYLDPSKNGYPDYVSKKRAKKEVWESRKTNKSSGSVYKNRVSRDGSETTSTRMKSMKSRRSSGTSTYDSHKSKSGKSSSTYQSERKRSTKNEKSSTKSSKINKTSKSRKEKSATKSRSGNSGQVKKQSSSKSSSSSAGKRSSSSSSTKSKSSKSSQSDSSNNEKKSSRGRR
ncbi:MAG: PEGA domain-containing protein, partial [candidate division Zixibacteria bacterium]|nr:PEGA domain-containing protein [candidate division Zixibacteria bacterium]